MLQIKIVDKKKIQTLFIYNYNTTPAGTNPIMTNKYNMDEPQNQMRWQIGSATPWPYGAVLSDSVTPATAFTC